jgi:phosphohistidine phosphatase
MRLYVVQHGQAVAKDVDPQRSLSEQGRVDVERMASFLGGAGIRVSRILHSGKKRAEQTAALLAGAVGSGRLLAKTSGIGPLDPTDEFARTVSRWTEDTMVVGHLPFMGRLVSRLVVGDEATTTAAFQPGTIICLERGEEGGWSLAWMIRPELLAGRG